MRFRVVAIGLVVVAGAVWFPHRQPNGADSRSFEKATARSATNATPHSTPEPVSQSPHPAGVADLLAGAMERISAMSDAAAIRAELAALAAKLGAMPRDKATALLTTALRGRRDVATRLPFTVVEGGNLADAPTFRVWMLDQLGLIHPQAAAEFAREILATPQSADEWAVAMRDLARVKSSPEDAAFLTGKMRELLNAPHWQEKQSEGWFQAFDVAVHLRATDLAPDFAKFVRRTEREHAAVAKAAFIAMDHLTEVAPVELLTRLQAEPDLMTGRELSRANYFAKANVVEPQQRTLVEQYLLTPDRGQSELQQFAGLFPSENRMISTNLLTKTPTRPNSEIVANDRAILVVVEEWLRDPRFEKLRPQVEAIHKRLAGFVKQAETSK